MFDIELKPNSLSVYFENAGYSAEIINGKKRFRLFSSVENEYNSILKGVGLRDLSSSGIVEFHGKDVLDFLHRITSNSLKDLPKGMLAHTIFTTEKGRIIDAATILNFEDHQLLLCSDENKEKVVSWIRKYIITDDVNLNYGSDNYVFIEMLGPQAHSFLMLVCGNAVNDIKLNEFKTIRAEGLIFILAKLKAANGNEKFWILADAANGIELTKFMIEHVGPFDFNLIGDDAYKLYKISSLIPSAPGELNDQYNPHEAGILDFVSFTKGCYIGQEVIARLDTYDKVQKYLRKINFDKQVNADEKYFLYDENSNEAGTITSIAFLPRLNKSIALAYIKRAFAAEGQILTAKNESGNTAKVTVENNIKNK